jgi:hypothetical protein
MCETGNMKLEVAVHGPGYHAAVQKQREEQAAAAAAEAAPAVVADVPLTNPSVKLSSAPAAPKPELPAFVAPNLVTVASRNSVDPSRVEFLSNADTCEAAASPCECSILPKKLDCGWGKDSCEEGKKTTCEECAFMPHCPKDADTDDDAAGNNPLSIAVPAPPTATALLPTCMVCTSLSAPGCLQAVDALLQTSCQSRRAHNMPPSTPRYFTVAERTSTSVTLIWVAPETGFMHGLDSFRVDYKSVAGQQWESAVGDAKQAVAVLTGLEPGTYYQLEVVAVSEGGESYPATALTSTL